MIGTSVAGEFQHGRNHSRAHEKGSWPDFVARCVNAESQLRVETQWKAARSQALREGVELSEARLEPTGKRFRSKAIKDICRSEWFAARKRLGIKSPITADVAKTAFDDHWAQVSAGSSYTMAVKIDGSLWGWGSGQNYRIGEGTNISRKIPTQVNLETNWAYVSASKAGTRKVN